MRSVAIVGSGPSGLFLAKYINRSINNNVKLDIFEKLNYPFGLLKFGVAPDHPEVKKKFMAHFKPLFKDSNVLLYLNANIGSDITVKQLSESYDAVALCTGMATSKRFWANYKNCFGADKVVGWYNGSPEHGNVRFDLKNKENIVVVGNGNVALDIVRILAKSFEDLKNTEISPNALKDLQTSNIKKIVVLGRRGPLDVSFTPAELRELVALKDRVRFTTNVDLKTFSSPSNSRIQDKNLKIFENIVTESSNSVKEVDVEFRFFERIESISEKDEYLTSIATNGGMKIIPYNMVIECTGFYQPNIIYSNHQDKIGKMVASEGHLLHDNVFSCGWALNGPRGTVADSMIDAEVCSMSIINYLSGLKTTSKIGLEVNLLKKLNKWVAEF